MIIGLWALGALVVGAVGATAIIQVDDAVDQVVHPSGNNKSLTDLDGKTMIVIAVTGIAAWKMLK